MKNTIFLKLAFVGCLVLSLQAEYIRDSEKNIVIDSVSGLVWQDNGLSSPVSWAEAITTCENLILGGYDDWRLPNFNELYYLVDRNSVNPAISPVFYTPDNLTTSYVVNYWSSTTVADVSNYHAWYIKFDIGTSNFATKDSTCYVRCVRSGQ